MEKRYNIYIGCAQTLEQFASVLGNKNPGHSTYKPEDWEELHIITSDKELAYFTFLYPPVFELTLSLYDSINTNTHLKLWGIKPTLVRS